MKLVLDTAIPPRVCSHWTDSSNRLKLMWPLSLAGVAIGFIALVKDLSEIKSFVGLFLFPSSKTLTKYRLSFAGISSLTFRFIFLTLGLNKEILSFALPSVSPDLYPLTFPE